MRVNRDILRFCILRVFRPDLLYNQVQRFVEIFLEMSFSVETPFNYHEMFRNTDHNKFNLLLCSSTTDPRQELMRMRKVISKEGIFHVKSLNVKMLHELPESLLFGAQSGHWVLLENLDQVQSHEVMIMKFI